MAGRGAAVALIGAVGVVAVVSIASILQRVSAWASPSTADTEAAAQAAVAFVEFYGTFDYRQPDAQRERFLAMTAGPLRDTLAAASPDPASIGRELRRETRVVRTQMTAISSERVSVMVQAEVVTGRSTLADQETSTRTIQQLRCDLVQEAASEPLGGGGWRVDGFRLLSEQITAN